MNLDRDLWFVRWFFWSCDVMDQFTTMTPNEYRFCSGWRERHFRTNGTTLCQFFRVLLWGTLIYALTIFGYLFTGFVTLVLPFLLFSYMAVAEVAGFSIGIILAIVGVSYGLVMWIDHVETREPVQKKPKEEHGFVGLCWSYAKAVKQRFCPVVTFSEK